MLQMSAQKRQIYWLSLEQIKQVLLSNVSLERWQEFSERLNGPVDKG